MKKQIFGLFAVILALAFIGCPEPEPETPALTGTVTINNTSPKIGNTLTASYSGNGSGTATWQWLANDVVITGANSNTYVVASGDLNKTLKARVSYSNQSGSVTSNATSAVAQAAGGWGTWTATDISGTEQRVWSTDPTRIEQRLTGTTRFTFSLISGTAAYRVMKGTAIAGTVRIPDYYRPSSEVDFQPVTSINDGVSPTANQTGNTTVSMTGGAFDNCTSLTEIIIPASVTSIDSLAFARCTGLTSVTFATGSVITSGNFGAYAFYPSSSETQTQTVGEQSVTITIQYGGSDYLKTAYLAGGAGRYTRSSGGSNWTKQP